MQQATSVQPLEFQGKAGEFFKIWIVNIMLSIVTLGIYSAWAKVRTKRYFYSNTMLLNTPFEYLADPVKILKGRLLAFSLIVIYSVSGMASPVVQGLVLILFLLALPWIIIKSLKFNLYNSAYRNIRFHFGADYINAMGVFIGYPILVALTLGLAYPAFTRARKKFIIDHSAYGTSGFSMSATTGQFYGIYMKTTALVVLSFLLIFAVLKTVHLSDIEMFDTSNPTTFPIILNLLLLPLFVAAYAYLYTSTTNLVINHTQLQHCHFESRLKALEICWLYIANTLAIIFSLGLLIPWAMIRTSRYRISCLTMISEGDLDAFIAGEAEQAGALGEELDDLLDIDIGL